MPVAGREGLAPRLRGVALGVILMLTAVSSTRGQMSPGPLSAPHQDLDSALKCFTCHGKGEGSMREHCLACHTEIAFLVAHGRGLHARPGTEKCASCHPDHAGRDFAMVAWEEGKAESFDHARAGWPLEGKHSGPACRDCHKPAFQTSEVARLSKRKDRREGWIGLDPACLSCHPSKDVHRGALGVDCAKCHDPRAWKPAPRFDHAKTAYPLTGRHAKVACDTCHLAAALKRPLDAQGKAIPLYKPLPHKECSACHTDPHAGQLGTDCSRCHNSETWKSVDEKKFDHERTRYPLRGRHVTVPCARCHDPGTAGGKKPAFAACASCHADAHAGTATLAGKIVDCAACHRVEGWRPSTYTPEQHATTRYPLAGAHLRLDCAACHRKNPPGVPAQALGRAAVLMRPQHERCTSCHEDAHGGQLAARPDRGACEPCHRVEGWKPSTFGIAEHARLKLPLQGRHASVPCAACHGPARQGLPPLPGRELLGRGGVALGLRETSCTDCHFDPHEGRFAARGERPKANGCVACHDTRAFRPSTVDVAIHRTFGLPLEGAHRAVPCQDCHRESKAAPSKSSLLLNRSEAVRLPFILKERTCEACHRSPHGNQFAQRRDRGGCAGCHNEDVFRPASRFDHARDAGFPLQGAHARVACARCHPSRRDAAGKPFITYRPAPRECKACHGPRPIGKLARIDGPEDRS
ncbi:MAG TPA: cytochrome c3 family protein [Candidatus Polarisedimenticolia bacterium]|nr:cytochrome c3 family protein [Candidatus Polarisedimenticolia bacterium]